MSEECKREFFVKEKCDADDWRLAHVLATYVPPEGVTWEDIGKISIRADDVIREYIKVTDAITGEWHFEEVKETDENE